MVSQLQGQLIQQRPKKSMEERLCWVTYKNLPILYFDFSHCSEREMLVVFSRGIRLLRENGLSQVLTLVNANVSPKSRRVMDFSQRFAMELEPYISKSAVYGLNSRSHFMVKMVKTFTGSSLQLCASRDEALDALISSK